MAGDKPSAHGRMAMRILIVSYFWPPSTSVGGARWSAMACALRALGHDVRVLTSALHGTLEDDRRNGVVRAGDLGASMSLRSALRRPALDAPAAAVPPAPSLLTKVLVPDSYLASWLPWALAQLVRHVRAAAIDCLVTSGPPSSTHLLGFVPGWRRPRCGVWLADFRDGWRFEPPDDVRWPTRVQDDLDARLEARVARAADAAIGVTRPIAEDLARRLGARAAWVPNGWDPGLDGEIAATPPPDGATRPGWLTIAHTGTLSGPWGRDPRPLLRAIARVNAEDRRRRPLRLVLAGRPTSEDERLLAGSGLGDALVRLGHVERAQALALQRAADALALITSDNRSEATGKLFEYLAAGRPIVALARGNEAARIVAETGTGIAVAPDDEPAIAAALRRVASGELAAEYRPRDLDRFRYPAPALTVERLIDEALSERRARSPRARRSSRRG